jgi:hypothetical protein
VALENNETLRIDEIKGKRFTQEKFSFWLKRILLIGLLAFIVILPFHLVLKRLLLDPWGTYWKEILLGVLVLVWATLSLLERRFPIRWSELNRAVLFYLGLVLLRVILDRAGIVTAWGFYIWVLYLPLVWLVQAVLNERAERLKLLLGLMVATGGVVALGGIIEFVLNVSLWPSAEMLQRQGFSDVFVYGTQLRRVYFVFDSPTTLANSLGLLLPIAIALGLVSKGIKWRLFAFSSALLMLVCLVVTFSRGVWIATSVSVLLVLVLGVYVFRDQVPQLQILRRTKILALIPLGIITFSAVIVVWIVTTSDVRGVTDPGTLELSFEAYTEIPVTLEVTSLLDEEPVFGEIEIQEWTLFDPIMQQDDYRKVIYEHPPEVDKREIIYRVSMPEEGGLLFAIALSPEVWTPDKGDGASFKIFITDPNSSADGEFVFNRYINPKHNPTDRRWRNYLVNLRPWAGATVDVSLITECGPAADCRYDWAGWADVRVVSVQQGFYEQSMAAENPAIRHIFSIFDWAEDETNRDRLAAWRTGLSAWQSNPIWGSGLGTTGVAALNTQPDRAYVTESQFLKSLVELGVPGLFVLGYLWYAIGKTGLLALLKSDDKNQKLLLLGLLGSLLVIFIEGWVYQNLEVKQVNAAFWTISGILAYLAGAREV